MATLDEKPVDDFLLLKISGTLTFEGVAAIHKRYEHLTQGGRVLVDLADVSAISTPGISMLLSSLRRLQHQGGQLLLMTPSRSVCDVLKRCRLERIFTIVESSADALKLLQLKKPA